ncbi:MAG: hypothetical protein ONA90_03770 [candidate division KSB1 bacterium]|nr:hypothetical protein [candidate division KSB1 bacterium]
MTICEAGFFLAFLLNLVILKGRSLAKKTEAIGRGLLVERGVSFSGRLNDAPCNSVLSGWRFSFC